MTPITKQRPEIDMETLTLDVRGIPDEKVHYLQQLIERWKRESQPADAPPKIVKRKVDPSEFIVKKSHIIGGELTRAMAYDDDI